MAINKIIYNGGTLIDLTGDTVTADKLMQGYTAHDRTGALITGTATGGSGDGYVWQDDQGYLHLSDEEGSSVNVEALSVTENGTYTAPVGTAYSPVTVNVSGGGGSSYTLLASNDFTFDTTSTSAINIGTMTAVYTNPYKTILLIQIRDKAGKRNGYFFGTDTYWQQPIAGSQQNDYRLCNVLVTNESGVVQSTSTSQYGVYPYIPIFSSGSVSINIRGKYNASYSGIVDGTYTVKLYALQYPDNVSPFE